MPIPENLLQKIKTAGRVILSLNNTEAYLAGIYPNIQNLDGVHGDQSSIAGGSVDFGPNMEILAKHTNNFFRHWVIFYPNFVNAGPEPAYPNIDKTNCSEKQPSITSAGQPWRERYSPFLYDRATDKWDLWRYNEEYFRKLRRMIEQAYDYGLVVQLTLFDRCGIDAPNVSDKCLRWTYSPWNARRNVNQVINTSDNNGVAPFYKPNLQGQITYVTGHLDRTQWPHGDPSTLTTQSITLGQLQDLYLDKVLDSTVEYPNVCYEIMNEPTRGDTVANIPERIRWADAIVGTIWRHTQGKRFIFYNDLSAQLASDVLTWQSSQNALPNYGKLDGITFHGDFSDFDPTSLANVIRQDLIIQVSSDTFTNESTAYNKTTAQNAFGAHMMFQAEAVNETAADGIGSALPPPTILRLAPLVATWIKISENPPTVPHLFYTQNADGTLVSMNPDNDNVSMRGRVIRFDSGKLWLWNPATQSVGKHRYSFQNNGLQLTLVRDDGWTQVFKKYQGGLAPFFYQWQKISDDPPSSQPLFYLFIYPDNSLVTRRMSDFVINNKGHITSVTPTQIGIHSDFLNNDVTWNYQFSDHGQQLTLQRQNPTFTQVFRRVA